MYTVKVTSGYGGALRVSIQERQAAISKARKIWKAFQSCEIDARIEVVNDSTGGQVCAFVASDEGFGGEVPVNPVDRERKAMLNYFREIK